MYWRPKHRILNFPLTCRSCVYKRRLTFFVTNLTRNTFTYQNSKTHALFRLFCYVTFWKVSFNFHLTFLQLNVINWNVHCAVKTVFYLTLGYFLRAPDNSNFFRFPLKVRESTVNHNTLAYSPVQLRVTPLEFMETRKLQPRPRGEAVSKAAAKLRDYYHLKINT